MVLDVRLPGMDGLSAMTGFQEPHRAGSRSSSSRRSATWKPRCGRWRAVPSITWSNPSTSTTPTTVVKRALETRKAGDLVADPRAEVRPRNAHRQRRRRCRTCSRASPWSRRPMCRCSSRARVGPARSWWRGPFIATAGAGTGLSCRSAWRALSPSLVEAGTLRPPQGVIHRGDPGPKRAPRTRQRRNSASG